jgi:hypothetical protein
MRTRPSTGFVVAGVSVVHFLGQVTSGVVSFSESMGRLDTGTPATLLERALASTSAVLGFPILPWIPPGAFPGLSGYLPVVANSLLWGLAAGLLFKVWRSRRER